MTVFQKLKQNRLFRHVLLLVTGAGLAQLIPLALMPALTRLYTPADFGLLALFTGIASILSVIATGRYELAVMLPKTDEDAISLVILSSLISGSFSLVILLVVTVFNEKICDMLGSHLIGPWLYLIPLTTFFSGFYQAANWWHNRKTRFKWVAVSRVSQSGSSALTQLVTGIKLKNASGLIFGMVIGQLLAAGYLSQKIWSNDRELIKKLDLATVKRNAIAYSSFPKFSVFGALVDSASLQMPIFMLNKFFNSQVTGMFSFTFRVLNLPCSLISTALCQVLFQKIVSIHHESPEKVRPYIIKVAGLLSLVMVPFVLAIGFFGENLFVLIFGEKWRQAGSFAAVLSVAVGVRFIVSPLSSVLAMERNIRIGVLWQVIYFVTITTTLFKARNVEINRFFMIFSIHEIVLYGLYFVFILYGARDSGSKV